MLNFDFSKVYSDFLHLPDGFSILFYRDGESYHWFNVADDLIYFDSPSKFSVCSILNFSDVQPCIFQSLSSIYSGQSVLLNRVESDVFISIGSHSKFDGSFVFKPVKVAVYAA